MPYRKPMRCLAAIFSLLSLTSAAGAQDTRDFAEVCPKVISETIYIPAPSKVQTKEKSVQQLASTLVVHNVDPDTTITLVSVASYDETGKLFDDRLPEAVPLAPFASKSFLTAIDDDRGGTGANYLLEWRSDAGACSPVAVAVMIGGAGTQGISFSLEGRVIERQYATDP